MFNIGMPELILILVVALLIFGPTKLPELARSLGKGLAEFRRASADLRSQILDPPVEPRPPEPKAAVAETTKPSPATTPPSPPPADAAAPEGTAPVTEAAAEPSAPKQGQRSVG